MSYTSKRAHFKSSRVVTLGEIDTETANEVIQLIYDINEEDNKKTQREPIKLIINSGGGDVYSGFALIDLISNSQTPVHTVCYGAAMSMALVVFVAGHYRLASQNATFMYHEAAYPIEGKVKHHKQELKETERIDTLCDSFLLSKTKLPKKKLLDTKNKQGEWYFDVEVAYKYGVVNKIL